MPLSVRKMLLPEHSRPLPGQLGVLALDCCADGTDVLLVPVSLPLPPQALSNEVKKNSTAMLRRLPTKLMMIPLVVAGDEPVANGD